MTYEKGHKWDFCGMCGYMIRCGTCGNNCCNGMHGTLEDDSECPDCPSAYKIQLNPTEEQKKDRLMFLEDKCLELYKELHKDDPPFGIPIAEPKIDIPTPE